MASRKNPKLKLISIGAELAGALIGFTLLGLWIDQRFGTGPWALIIGVIIGCVGGFYNLIRSSFSALETPEEVSQEANEDN